MLLLLVDNKKILWYNFRERGDFMAGAVQSVWMRCIIQSDFSQQMDVFRWLQNDDYYRCIWILHDHDIIQDESEVHDRLMPDGSEKHFSVGMVKPAHYHVIVRLPKKITADTFTKRFGSYVHFQVCSDPANYARYFLHNTFISQNKHQYDFSCVCGDPDLINDLFRSQKAVDQVACLRRFMALFDANSGDVRNTIENALAASDTDLVRSVMSHSYFYGRFICDLDKKGG